MRQAALHPQTEAELDKSRQYGLRTLFVLILPLMLGYAITDFCVGWYNAGRVGEADSNAFMRDEQLGYVSRPGYVGVWAAREEGEPEPPADAVRHNALGLRSEEIPPNAQPKEVRVLGVGASLAYGAGRNVQESIWNYRLQAMFDQKEAERGYPVRVLNGAVQGYSTYQAVKRGLMLLPVVQPDIVLVFVRPGRQSMARPSDAMQSVNVGGEWVPIDVVENWPGSLEFIPANIHKFLLEHSNIYQEHRTSKKNQGEGEELAPNFVLNRSEDWPVGTRERVNETLEEYRVLIEVCAKRGIEVRFVMNTEPEQQAEARWEKFLKVRQITGAPAIGTPRKEPTEVLREMIEGVGGKPWDLWDLAERFGRQPEYFTNIQRGDDHWNAEGHLAVAIELYKRLTEGGLLDNQAQARAAKPRTNRQ